ncbi:MAG: hypothetical protein KGN77_04735 [Xanthomonadaceae bacterium]|nr:hypothetical protein [Xanthomonadaceae bacterium]MDE1965276.1 hypothetical protein [Xanthomonadaceae bacterium]
MQALSFWFTGGSVLVYLLIVITFAVAATRLLWIAGSYLKRKRQLLDERP